MLQMTEVEHHDSINVRTTYAKWLELTKHSSRSHVYTINT